MPRQIPSDEELRAFAEEHLDYEVQMLQDAAHGLSQVNNSQFVRNVLLECFTIHLRTLIDFLWGPTKLREDDAIAGDFFTSAKVWEDIRPEKPSALEPACKRTNKEIAHLTYARMTVSPEAKGWDHKTMTEAIIAVLKLFAKNAEKSRLGKSLANL